MKLVCQAKSIQQPQKYPLERTAIQNQSLQPERRMNDEKERRYDRHFNKDRSPMPVAPPAPAATRGREPSPGPRSGNQGRRIKDSSGIESI